MKPLPRSRSCFVCGLANPIGLSLRFHATETAAIARLTFRPEHVGFARTVHGGLISTVLDEAMVWGCALFTGRFAYCAEMTVRFLKPVAPGLPLVVRGELAANRRGRIFEARAELRGEDGAGFATATGKYMPVAAEMLPGLTLDFVEDIGPVLALARGGAGEAPP